MARIHRRTVQKGLNVPENHNAVVSHLDPDILGCEVKWALSYVKQIASPGSMHETGHSGLVHWDDPEGWDGEASGRGVQDGEHMYTHG